MRNAPLYLPAVPARDARSISRRGTGTGMTSKSGVSADSARADPAEFVATTTTRMRLPASSAVNASVVSTPVEIVTQTAPDGSIRPNQLLTLNQETQ